MDLETVSELLHRTEDGDWGTLCRVGWLCGAG